MIRAGKLRHRITLLVDAGQKDSDGQVEPNWVPIGEPSIVWAAIEPIDSAKNFVAAETQEMVTHKLTLRYRGDLVGAMRATYQDPGTGKLRVFSFLGTPRSPEEQREFLEVLVAERSL